MPRKSTAALAVVTPLRKTPYPPAPTGLPKRQKALWTSITHSKPPDWWDAGSLPILQALVGHIATLEAIEAQFSTVEIDLKNQEGVKHLDLLSRLRDRESKAVAALSVKLRLTQQARYTTGSASTAARRGGDGQRPWEFDPDDPSEEFFRNSFEHNGNRFAKRGVRP